MLNNIGLPGLILIAVLIYGLYCKYVAFRKMGKNGWASLILLVPIVNLFYIWKVAHGHWENADANGYLQRVHKQS